MSLVFSIPQIPFEKLLFSVYVRDIIIDTCLYKTGREKMDFKRRVVITGLGVVAANGIGKDAFWQANIEGTSGVDKITAIVSASKEA